MFRITSIHFSLIFAAMVDGEIAEHRELMTDYTLEFARSSRVTAGEISLLEESCRWKPASGSPWERCCITSTPSSARPWRPGDFSPVESYVGHGLEVGGTQVANYFNTMLTPVFNILSRCPVLAVPSGFAENGVPTGVQIVGRTYDDETTFRLGAALEQVRPWMDTPERRPPL